MPEFDELANKNDYENRSNEKQKLLDDINSLLEGMKLQRKQSTIRRKLKIYKI